MIYGVGTDIVELARIQSIYDRFGDHFVKRLLMKKEKILYKNNAFPARFLAMRFAAKEAIVKAIGTGFSNGIWIRDIGVINDNNGRPIVIYSQRAEKVCQKIGIRNILVSLSDEMGLILAFAVATTQINKTE